MIEKGKQFWYLYFVLVILVLIRIIPFLYPASRTWGFNHLIFLPSGYSIAFFAIAAIALTLPFLKQSSNWGESFINWFSTTFFESPKRLLYRFLFILPIAGLFMIFAMPTHFLGDGYEVIRNVASDSGTFFKWSGSGITILLRGLRKLIGGDNNQSAVAAFQVVSYLSGIFSIWFYFKIVEHLSSDKTKRLLIFLVSLFSGSLLLFFGYAENYPPLWVAMTGMLYGGLKYIRTGRGLAVMWFFVFLGVILHLQMFILIPGAVYLTLFTGDNKLSKHQYRKYMQGAVLIVAFGLICAFVYKYYTDLFFQFMFLDFLPFKSEYSIFSTAHILDVINEAILLSPILLLLLLSFGKNELGNIKRQGLIFLGLISFGFLLFLAIISPQLGMPRDWDLLSPTLLTITLLLVLLIKQNFLGSLKQLILSVTIILFVSPLPYLLTNLNHANSAKYCEYFCSLDLKRSTGSLLILYKYYEDHRNTKKLQEIKNVYVANFTKRKKLDSVLAAINVGDLKSATEILGRIEPNKYDGNYQRILWLYYFRQGDFKKAMNHIEQTIQLNRYNCDIYGDRAKIHMAREHYDNALDDLRHGYNLNNTSKYIIDGLSNLYFKLQQYDSTIYYCQKRIQLDSSNYNDYYRLVVSYAYKHNIKMAQKYFNKYAEFDLKDSRYLSQFNDLSELIKRLEENKNR
ncbi:MAG: hypothetical protein GY865_06530 [candidate division Zixibacteria bacterium]|nr:hypothetical protein [candidate division Zixibacteria bacterium]